VESVRELLISKNNPQNVQFAKNTFVPNA